MTLSTVVTMHNGTIIKVKSYTLPSSRRYVSGYAASQQTLSKYEPLAHKASGAELTFKSSKSNAEEKHRKNNWFCVHFIMTVVY